MLLNIKRHGRVYEVQAPPGSRVHMFPDGRPRVSIGGMACRDTCLMLTMATVVECARRGLYGLAIRSEAVAG
jgi:hypothetical protein